MAEGGHCGVGTACKVGVDTSHTQGVKVLLQVDGVPGHGAAAVGVLGMEQKMVRKDTMHTVEDANAEAVYGIKRSNVKHSLRNSYMRLSFITRHTTHRRRCAGSLMRIL